MPLVGVVKIEAACLACGHPAGRASRVFSVLQLPGGPHRSGQHAISRWIVDYLLALRVPAYAASQYHGDIA